MKPPEEPGATSMNVDPWHLRELIQIRMDALELSIRLIGDRRFEYPPEHNQNSMLLKDYELIAVGTAQRFLAWILTGKY